MSLACVLFDGYDREVYEGLAAKEKALVDVRERARRLLPHADHLFLDLFSILFKMNVVLLDERELSASALVHRRLLNAVLRSPGIVTLRDRTRLDPSTTCEALIYLGHKILDALTSGDRVVASELLSIADAAMDEELLEQRKKELEHLEELPEGAFGEDREALEKSLKQDIRKLTIEAKQSRKKQSKLAFDLPLDIESDLDRQITAMPETMDELSDDLRALGMASGAEGRMPAHEKMALGERLMRSKKLRLLARLTGAFKDVALEARKKRVSRAPQETHAIEQGRQLERVLPSELFAMKRERRALHLDFVRRFVEGELLQYQLEGPAQRGPMVVCVDGSGSMHGPKEIWSKAVALTLMEIARREKRRCLALVFSSGHTLFEVELLSKKRAGGRPQTNIEEVLRFAEHFPGGGTNFEEPLSRALELVGDGRYRRGDIVFITDGEASVSQTLLDDIAARRKRHRFAIRGILVDVAHAQAETMEKFCDSVKLVSELTADTLVDLFGAV